MPPLPQTTHIQYINGLRHYQQWLDQFPGHCEAGLAGLAEWAATGIALLRGLPAAEVGCQCDGGASPRPGLESSRPRHGAGFGAHAAVATVLLFGACAQGAQLYSVTDLGTLGGGNSGATAINNSGQIVGHSDIAGNASTHAFLYSNGVMSDLGTLGGTSSDAFALNDSGQVAGSASTAHNAATHAFLYSGGGMVDLGTLGVGGTSSSAAGINNSGQVVGTASTAYDATAHAFLYSGGAMSDLGTLGGYDSFAYDINNKGQVVGNSFLRRSPQHAFLYSGGVMNDIGILLGDNIQSNAVAINDNGQVAVGGGAFLYSDGVMTNLNTGAYWSWSVQGMNNKGQLVGIHRGYGFAHAVLYSDGTLVDLNDQLVSNDAYLSLISAVGINDAGQIVGYGLTGGVLGYGDIHAFLLTPTFTTISPKNIGLADPHCPSVCEGNPINAATGNKFQAETDYVGGAATHLELNRYYNSQDTTALGFGRNWHSSWHRSLAKLSDYLVKITRADGRVDTFRKDVASGAWQADPDVTSRLVALFNASNQQTGWQLSTDDDSREIYTLAGKLSSITTRAGLTTTLAYDAANHLTKVTGPFGHALGFAYDAAGRVKQITGPDGGLYGYTYDANNNNLLSVTYPNATVRRYAYENASFPNALTGISDENGVRYASFAYDAQGRAISTQHAGGAELTQIAYHADGSATVTDPRGNTHGYSFTTQFDRVKPTAVSGTPVPTAGGKAFSYDANGFVASRTDFNGNVTTYTHDARGLETSRTEAYGTPLARTVTTAWHASFHLPTQIAEPNRATTFSYDAKGNLTQRTVTAGSLARTWRYAYDANGQVTQIDGPRTDVNDLTKFSYDAKGNLVSVTDALGHVVKITAYDANGRPLSVQDPNGLATKLAYDPRGRLLSRNVGGEITRYGYDAAGQVRKITQPDTRFTLFSYDQAHRLTQVNDNLGNRIAYTLDAADNRIKERIIDPANTLALSLSRTFDALDRLKTSVGAAGQTTTFGYDDNGNLTGVSDPLANATTHSYDALNRLAASLDPLSGKTQYAYDANDNLAKVIDPRGLATSYLYDGLGNRTQTLSPDSGKTLDSFDAAGNRVGSTDARGKKTLIAYDALNRPKSQSFASGTPVQFTYDSGVNGLGRLTGLSDETGNTAWSYEIHGRVAQKSQTIGTTTQKLGYAYDAYGRLAQISYPSGNTVNIAYDAAGRPAQLALGNQTILTSLQYTAFGAVKSWVWGNGQSYARSFDLDGRLAAYPLGRGRGNSLGFDKASRITDYNDSAAANQQHFQYDALARLLGVSQGATLTGYAYDADGNRASQTVQTTGSSKSTNYTYPVGSNRLAKTQGVANFAFSYDAAGNTTGDGIYLYSYNDRGRLAQVNYAGALTQFGINGLGQRVVKTAGTATTLFMYDEAGHLLGEYQANGTAIRETVWLGDTPVAAVAGGAVYPIFADHLNTPRAVADSTGKVLWRWDTEPFGSGKPNQDADGDGVAFVYNLRFPGQYYDVETGLHYNYFRDYDPRIGRYLQSDPIGLAGGDFSMYSYVNEKPTGKIDSKGMESASVSLMGSPPALTASQAEFVLGIYLSAATAGEAIPIIITKITKSKCLAETIKNEKILKEMREKLAEAEDIDDMWRRNQARLDAIAEAMQQQGYTAKEIVKSMKGLIGF